MTNTSYFGVFFYAEENLPKDQLSQKEINIFLSELATKYNVSSSMHNQALAALLFYFRFLKNEPLDILSDVVRAKKPVREEVQQVFKYLSRDIGLRIQDIDFGQNEIIIKRGKGDKGRRTILPGALKTEIQNQMEKVKKIHDQDLKDGFGEVELPDSIAKKYPTAAKDFRWTECSDLLLGLMVLCVSV